MSPNIWPAHDLEHGLESGSADRELGRHNTRRDGSRNERVVECVMLSVTRALSTKYRVSILHDISV